MIFAMTFPYPVMILLCEIFNNSIVLVLSFYYRDLKFILKRGAHSLSLLVKNRERKYGLRKNG